MLSQEWKRPNYKHVNEIIHVMEKSNFKKEPSSSFFCSCLSLQLMQTAGINQLMLYEHSVLQQESHQCLFPLQVQDFAICNQITIIHIFIIFNSHVITIQYNCCFRLYCLNPFSHKWKRWWHSLLLLLQAVQHLEARFKRRLQLICWVAITQCWEMNLWNVFFTYSLTGPTPEKQ